MEGQVITPPNVTVPAGNLSATFTTLSAPQTALARYALVQAHYGTSGGSQARILEVDPSAGAPTLPRLARLARMLLGASPLAPRSHW